MHRDERAGRPRASATRPTGRPPSWKGLALAGVFLALFALLLGISVPGRGAHRASTSATGASRSTSTTTVTRATVAGSSNAPGLPFASPSGRGMRAGPNLAPGSNPAVLPGDVLIADEGNNRLLIVNPAGTVVWQIPRPGDVVTKKAFVSPDDAFFTPDGRHIMATEEEAQVASLLDLRTGKILWRYGTLDTPGGGANHLSNPDDALELPNGDVLIADIRNCSLLLVKPPSHTPLQRFGIDTTGCLHDPPLRFGSPNGAFPLTDGNYLVTEINGDWVDEMTLSGKVLWSTHPPGVAYPSDTNEVRPGVFLTVDYSTPGQIVEFNAKGALLWRYGPTSGPGMLKTPSLCEPIPTNGDIICNDDANDRVIVVDPRTNTIVWQYGHRGVAGSVAGYLNGPDGVDLAPPYSVLVRHASTMGVPPLACAPGLPTGACTLTPTG